MWTPRYLRFPGVGAPKGFFSEGTCPLIPGPPPSGTLGPAGAGGRSPDHHPPRGAQEVVLPSLEHSESSLTSGQFVVYPHL